MAPPPIVRRQIGRQELVDVSGLFLCARLHHYKLQIGAFQRRHQRYSA